MTTSAQIPDALSRALNQAFEALNTYEVGSPRGALMPIDDAVARASGNARDARRMERRLLDAWGRNQGSAARLFLLGKLVLAGGEAAMPLLGRCLLDPVYSHAARNALEGIPSAAAVSILAGALPRTSGVEKAGIINSLAHKREKGQLRTFTKLLRDGDLRVAEAAVAAIGKLGSARAEKVLRSFAATAPERLQPEITDALLACGQLKKGQAGREPPPSTSG